MPRFVILRHEMSGTSGRASHYDLMLEQGGVLRTWACDALPHFDSPTLADSLPDHRLAYLTYEGEVSGGRGSVSRVAAGEYVLLAESGDLVRLQLVADTLSGVLTIARDGDASVQRWRVSLAGPPASSS
jgi:hypothetical protein